MISFLYLQCLFFRIFSKCRRGAYLAWGNIVLSEIQFVGMDWVPACAGTTRVLADCRLARKALGHRHAFAVRGNDGS